MKKRRVWRYSCEFCRKSGCHGGHMRDHELRCFRNPNRRCIVCSRQWPIPELAEPMAAMANINEATEPAMLAAVREIVEACPACMCAAISQAPLPMVRWDIPGGFFLGEWHEGRHGESRYRVTWDYKKERDAYRADQRAEETSYL